MIGIQNINIQCRHIPITYNLYNKLSSFCVHCGAILETSNVKFLILLDLKKNFAVKLKSFNNNQETPIPFIFEKFKEKMSNYPNNVINKKRILKNPKRQDIFQKIKLIQKRLKFNYNTYIYACCYFDKIVSNIKEDNTIDFDAILISCILLSGIYQFL